MLTQERLREVLFYDPETGVFRWLKRISIRIVVGEPAGTLMLKGYLGIGIDGNRYYAHRLAWFWTYGDWPPQHTDHINGIKTDNRIANLRKATAGQNLSNSRVRHDSKSGVKGVHWCPDRCQWEARVKREGKRYWLGRFHTIEQAKAAYDAAAMKLNPEFSRL